MLGQVFVRCIVIPSSSSLEKEVEILSSSGVCRIMVNPSNIYLKTDGNHYLNTDVRYSSHNDTLVINILNSKGDYELVTISKELAWIPFN